MADAAPPKLPVAGPPKQNGVSERIKNMQVGQFGANLAAMLQMQNQVTASKAKIPEGAVKMPMPRMAAKGEKIISFTVEASKGSSVTLKYSDSTTVNDVFNEAQTQLSLKKDAERLGLYNPNTGIFLRGELSLKMHLVKDEDKLEIKARKDKGTFVKVFHRGKDEMELVEIHPSTTTIGLIQLLGNKDPDTADQFGLYLSNGTRLENDLKLSSVIKGGATVILEYRPNNMQVVAPNLPPPPPIGSIPLPSAKSNPNLLPPPPPMPNIPPPPQLDSSDETPDTSSEKDPQKKKLKMSAKNQKDKKKIGKKGIPEDSETDKVPPLRFEVVQQLVAYLDAKGLEEVGLFRESAPLTEVKKLYSQFFNDKLDMSQVFDPHVAAGALKLYFREQPEALIPPSTCQEYSDAAKAGQDNEALLTIIKDQFLPRLSQPNKNILHILLNLLSKLAKLEEKNRMNPNAIAICFAPTVIFDRNAAATTSMLEFEASKWTVPFIVRLIENYEAIYGGQSLPSTSSSPLRSSSSGTGSPMQSRRNSSPAVPNAPVLLPPPPTMDMSTTLPPPPKPAGVPSSPRKQPPEPQSPRRNVTSMELPSANSPKGHSPKGGKRPVSVDMSGIANTLVRAVSTNSIERPMRPPPPQGMRQSSSQTSTVFDPKAVINALNNGTPKMKIDAAVTFMAMKDDQRFQTYVSNLPPNFLLELLTNVTATLSKCTAPSE